MTIPKKIRDFFNENKSTSRDEVLQSLMDTFNIKKSTAITYYSNKKVRKKNAQDLVFKFLEENPEAVDENVSKEYAEKIGVNPITYRKYRSLYKVKNCNQKSDNREVRKREKFLFDDSRL